MKRTPEILEEFLAGNATPFTKFSAGNLVTIIKGSYKGYLGTVTHLISIKPTVRYLVELSPNEYAKIDQHSLQSC